MGQELSAVQADVTSEVGNLETLLDGLINPFYALDQSWRFTHFNRGAEEHFGLRRDEVLGRSIWDIFPEQVGGKFDRSFCEVLASGKAAAFETSSSSALPN